jgi:hypothetical protein
MTRAEEKKVINYLMFYRAQLGILSYRFSKSGKTVTAMNLNNEIVLRKTVASILNEWNGTSRGNHGN